MTQPNAAFEDWARNFLLRTERGARIGRELAGRRPSRAHLGRLLRLWVGLLSARIAAETATWTGELAAADPEREVDRTAWRPRTDAPADQERGQLIAAGWSEQFLTPDGEDDSDLVALTCRHVVEGLIDHMRALTILLEAKRVSRAVLVLGRVLLDGSAHINHLLDPDINSTQRLIRCLNLELRRLGEDYEVAREEGDQERAAEITERIDQIGKQADLVVAQAVTWPGRNRGRGLPRIGQRDNKIVVAALDGSRSVLHTLSSAVHLQEDAGFRIGIGVDFIRDDPHAASRILLYLSYPLLAVVRMQELIGQHFAWDLSPVSAATPELLSKWAAGAGLNDAEIRQQILREWGEPDPDEEPLPPMPSLDSGEQEAQ